jgi:hypothetical protein
MHAYEDSLIAGNYAQAWSMLAPDGVGGGTLATYTVERKAYLASAGEAYPVEANPKDALSLPDWLSGTPFAASVDKAHAVLIRVWWTALAGNNAGWEMWVVNPISGGWALYEVR